MNRLSAFWGFLEYLPRVCSHQGCYRPCWPKACYGYHVTLCEEHFRTLERSLDEISIDLGAFNEYGYLTMNIPKTHLLKVFLSIIRVHFTWKLELSQEWEENLFNLSKEILGLPDGPCPIRDTYDDESDELWD